MAFWHFQLLGQNAIFRHGKICFYISEIIILAVTIQMADIQALQLKIELLERENADLKKRVNEINHFIASDGNEKEFKQYQKTKRDVERVKAINDEVRQMSDPQAILQNFNRLFRITYIIKLRRYMSRPHPPPPRFERPKVMYIGANDGETIAQIKDRAIRVIERHWDLQRQSGTEVEIPFNHISNNDATFQYANRYVDPHLSKWLKIQDQYIRDITNAPNFNQLIALGKSWKCSILDELNKKEFKLRDGMCWLDYLEQKLVGQSGFRHLTRVTLQEQLEQVTGKSNGYCNDDIIKWIKHYNYAISLYSLDPNYEVRTKYIPPANKNRNTLKILCYMINNQHIYPIENSRVFKSLGIGHLQSLHNYDQLNPKHKINHKCNFKNFIKYENSDNINDLVNGTFGFNNNTCKDVVYFDKNDINWRDLMVRIIQETGYAPDVIRPHNQSFVHPISHQLYQQTEMYDERLNISKKLKQHFNYLNFEWHNQTITQMSKIVFENVCGFLPKSTHTQLAIGLLDNYGTMPLTENINENILSNKKHYDINKCYANVAVDILKNELLPIHTIMDNIEPFNHEYIDDLPIGLYLIDEIIHPSGLRIETQWIPHYEVEYYLKKEIITPRQIKLQYLSRYYINGNIIAKFVEYLFDNFDNKTANRLWHHLYGSWNTKRRKLNYAFITNDENMALSYNKEFLGQADYSEIGNGNWLVERKINERVECDNVGLYTCVLAGGRMKLIDMIDGLPENVILNGVRVDSIYVSYNDDTAADIQKWEKKNLNLKIPCVKNGKMATAEERPKCQNGTSKNSILKKYKIEDTWNIPSKKRILRVASVDINDFDLSLMEMKPYDTNADYSNTNILVQGFAGSNKTGELVKYYTKYKNNGSTCKCIAFTNCAVQNLINRGVLKDDCLTTANFLGWTGKGYTRDTSNTFDLLSIDEYSMNDVSKWLRIYKKVKYSGCVIHAFGDKNQCCAVEGQIKYDITKTQFLRQLLGNNGLLLEKHCIGADGVEPRCDKYITTIVTRMLDDPEHRLPGELFYPKYEWLWERHPTAIGDTMICKTNKMVDKLNNKLNDKIKIGCKVIINEINDKKLNVWNGERYIVKRLIGDKVELEEWIADPTIRYKTLKKRVIVPFNYIKLANAATAYKYQGLTLYEPYIIFEPHCMNLQEFIVSLTRAKKLSQIRITNKYQLQNKSFPNVFKQRDTAEIEVITRLKPIDLYLLREQTTNRAYIGVTDKTLSERLTWHKSPTSNCKCNDFDWNNTTIVSLGTFLATSVEDNAIERSYIQDFNKFSPYNMVNYRENNYKIDLTKQNDSPGKSTTETIDLSNKFLIREAKDNRGGYYYIQAKKSQRKARFGKKYTKKQAYDKMVKARKELLQKHYPNASN